MLTPPESWRNWPAKRFTCQEQILLAAFFKLKKDDIKITLYIIVAELVVFNSATFGAFLHFFGPLGAIFLPFGAYCVVGVRFKNIFGTYLCRQPTLVLEILPYLFVFYSAKFGAFLHFLSISGLFQGLGSKLFWDQHT